MRRQLQFIKKELINDHKWLDNSQKHLETAYAHSTIPAIISSSSRFLLLHVHSIASSGLSWPSHGSAVLLHNWFRFGCGQLINPDVCLPRGGPMLIRAINRILLLLLDAPFCQLAQAHAIELTLQLWRRQELRRDVGHHLLRRHVFHLQQPILDLFIREVHIDVDVLSIARVCDLFRPHCGRCVILSQRRRELLSIPHMLHGVAVS